VTILVFSLINSKTHSIHIYRIHLHTPTHSHALQTAVRALLKFWAKPGSWTSRINVL